MLLPDNIYQRLPILWMLMGILFLVFGLLAGPELWRVATYLGIGIVSIGRSFWLYQARQRVARKSEVTVLTDTQIIERNHSE